MIIYRFLVGASFTLATAVNGRVFSSLAKAGTKSDLRNHCAIVQPRLYDSAVVTQITRAVVR
jgi:hypothetical protein